MQYRIAAVPLPYGCRLNFRVLRKPLHNLVTVLYSGALRLRPFPWKTIMALHLAIP